MEVPLFGMRPVAVVLVRVLLGHDLVDLRPLEYITLVSTRAHKGDVFSSHRVDEKIFEEAAHRRHPRTAVEMVAEVVRSQVAMRIATEPRQTVDLHGTWRDEWTIRGPLDTREADRHFDAM